MRPVQWVADLVEGVTRLKEVAQIFDQVDFDGSAVICTLKVRSCTMPEKAPETELGLQLRGRHPCTSARS